MKAYNEALLKIPKAQAYPGNTFDGFPYILQRYAI